MNQISKPRILVVYKRSAYQQFAQHRSRQDVDRLLSKVDPVVSHIRSAHEDHLETVQTTKTLLNKLGSQAIFKKRITENDVNGFDLVVTLGGDGTLLHASHAVGPNLPILAINSAPGSSVGYFCGGTRHNLEETLVNAIQGRIRKISLSRMQITINQKKISTRVLNDALFSHPMPSLPCTYQLYFKNKFEEQRSSGIWVGPAAGSTAAQHSAGGKVLPLKSKKLQFVVREPYQGTSTIPKMLQGLIQPKSDLQILSKIRDARLFIDGSHQIIPVHIGQRILFSLSDESLTLLGDVASFSKRS